ncbi:hypothetical protein [Cellulosimicrobium protaetiae]
MTTTLPAPTTRRDVVLPRLCGRTPSPSSPPWPTERLVAGIATDWLASDDPAFRAMGRRSGRNLAADVLDDELIGLRRDLTRDLDTARADVDDIAEETQVYLGAALDPDVTWADVNTYVTWVFDAAAGDPDQHGHAAALAAAALRGWTHRQALAGGVR